MKCGAKLAGLIGDVINISPALKRGDAGPADKLGSLVLPRSRAGQVGRVGRGGAGRPHPPPFPSGPAPGQGTAHPS